MVLRRKLSTLTLLGALVLAWSCACTHTPPERFILDPLPGAAAFAGGVCGDGV